MESIFKQQEISEDELESLASLRRHAGFPVLMKCWHNIATNAAENALGGNISAPVVYHTLNNFAPDSVIETALRTQAPRPSRVCARRMEEESDE